MSALLTRRVVVREYPHSVRPDGGLDTYEARVAVPELDDQADCHAVAVGMGQVFDNILAKARAKGWRINGERYEARELLAR